jgi:hypothetical protein
MGLTRKLRIKCAVLKKIETPIKWAYYVMVLTLI